MLNNAVSTTTNWNNFTVAMWITTKTSSSSLISLGRTPSNFDGEFVFKIESKKLSFFDYSYDTSFGFVGSARTDVTKG